jgi:hypothetical protein
MGLRRARALLEREQKAKVNRMRALHISIIGGGRVVRGFRWGTEFMRAGTEVTREQLLKMPQQNRNALIEKGYITVWPVHNVTPMDAPLTTGKTGAAALAEGVEKHVISSGYGRYNVIEGRKLNDRPLSKEEAYGLAGKEMPAAKSA